MINQLDQNLINQVDQKNSRVKEKTLCFQESVQRGQSVENHAHCWILLGSVTCRKKCFGVPPTGEYSQKHRKGSSFASPEELE